MNGNGQHKRHGSAGLLISANKLVDTITSDRSKYAEEKNLSKANQDTINIELATNFTK